MAGGAVVRNVNQVRRSLRGLKNKVRKAVIEAAEDNMIDLADKAFDLAPKDTGRLESSANPEVEVKGNRVNGKVTFSAKNPETGYDYALIQHEVPFNHPKKGEWKYLEKPLKENARKYKQHMDNKVGEALK